VKRLFFGRQWGAVLIVVTLLVVGGALGFANLQRAQDVPTDLIRLHVVAHSDANRDQQVKLAVRDAVLREMTPVFQAVQDVGDARRILQENLDRIAMSARVVLQDHNCPYDVRVQAGVFPFPERTYGSLFLPAGDYQSLQVVLGDGMGCNWWCVLFPPLCFVEAPVMGGPTVDAFAYREAVPVMASGQAQIVVEERAPELRLACWDWLRARQGELAAR